MPARAPIPASAGPAPHPAIADGWRLADDDSDEDDGASPRSDDPAAADAPQPPGDNPPARADEPPPLPSSLTQRHLDHVVLIIDAPAAPYVTADPWDRFAASRSGCMRTGPVLLGRGPNSTVRHVVVPCFSTTCRSCGPERHRTILRDMAVHWAPLPAVFLHAIRSPTVGDEATQRRTVTDAIRRKRGQYLWLSFSDGDDLVCLVFSDVDHSTTRPNRGHPPRSVDRLSPDDALAYLDYLMYHGLRWPHGRGASREWPLSDGERASAKAGPAASMALRPMGARSFERLIPVARLLYRQDRDRFPSLPEWPAHMDAPALADADRIGLFDRARTEILTPGPLAPP